jgi:hypothetical protein
VAQQHSVHCCASTATMVTLARYNVTLGCLSETKQICLQILRAHFATPHYEDAKGTFTCNDVRHDVDVHTLSFLTHAHLHSCGRRQNMSGSDDVP